MQKDIEVGDVVYYRDKIGKFYYDMIVKSIEYLKEYDSYTYCCQIMGNKRKFLNNNYEFDENRIGEISCYSRLNIVKTLQEAEKVING